MTSAVTYPLSGCTHPRLVPNPLVSPLNGILVGWLASPLIGAQRYLLEHLDQRANDDDKDVDSWIHQYYI